MRPKCYKEAVYARVLLLTVMVCLLQVQLCSTQRILIQVLRGPDDTINILQQTQYYIFEGQGLSFRCICNNQGATESSRIESLRWIHKGRVVESSDQCLPLSYQLTDATSENSGEHICEASHADGTVSRESAGTLEIVDPSRILAPPFQYGLIDTSTSLNCTTTFNDTNRISITWTREGEDVSHQLDRVRLDNEGLYKCSVFLGNFNLRAERMINFSVIVPPVILNKPDPYLHMTGNQPALFSVQYQSRLQVDTAIVWFKNNNAAVPSNLISTQYTDESNATTQIQFNNLRRSDTGSYTLVVQNNFPGLSLDTKRAEASFQLDVTVKPVAPSNIIYTEIQSNFAVITWELTNQNEDDHPDNITVRLFYPNNSQALQKTVEGTERELRVDLVPGTAYKLVMTAANIDGEVNTMPQLLISRDGAPSTPNVRVARGPTSADTPTFTLTVSLAYTGGGNITEFPVLFRSKQNIAAGWQKPDLVEQRSTPNVLEWTIIARDSRLSEHGVEFQVSALNERNHQSEMVTHLEPLDLPGPPTKPTFVLAEYNSLVIQVKLSEIGSNPITAVHIRFPSHPAYNRTWYAPYETGQLIQDTISGLQSSTLYQLEVIAENYAGMGEPSPLLEASTDDLPPVPLYGLVLISTGAAIIIVLLVIFIVLLTRYCYTLRKKKRQYKFNSGSSPGRAEKSLGSDKLVSGTKRPPLPKTPTQTTPHSPIFSDSDRPASQSTYSRQGSTSTYPLSPQRTISTSDGSSPIGQFEFERRDSMTLSNESESEINCPRYLYRVSPSPPNLSTPQLIAPSLHSMQSFHSTMTTQLTGNLSNQSTRESLLIGPAEFKATNV